MPQVKGGPGRSEGHNYVLIGVWVLRVLPLGPVWSQGPWSSLAGTSGSSDGADFCMAAQVPDMKLAFLPPDSVVDTSPEQGPEGSPDGRRLAIQSYPGKMSYASMSQFLTSFAGIFG